VLLTQPLITNSFSLPPLHRTPMSTDTITQLKIILDARDENGFVDLSRIHELVAPVDQRESTMLLSPKKIADVRARLTTADLNLPRPNATAFRLKCQRTDAHPSHSNGFSGIFLHCLIQRNRYGVRISLVIRNST
jgi:hypothetical protein